MKKIIRIILVLIILALGAGWFFGTSIAEKQVRAYLKGEGVPVESLSVSSIWFDSVTLSNVKMGKDTNVSIDSVTLMRTEDKTYPYAMDASGLALKARVDGELVDLGGVEKLWQKQSFPANPAKPISISIKTDADLKSDGAKAVSGLLDIAKLVVKQKDLETTLINTDVTIHTEHGPQYKAPFTIDELNVVQNGTEVVAPLTVKGEVIYNPQTTLADVLARIDALDEKMQADVLAKYTVKAEQGTIQITTPELQLGEGKLELSKLLPSAAKDTPTPDMSLVLKSVITLAKGDWQKMDVNATFDNAPVAKLLEKALGKGATLEGQIKGNVPITLTKQNWRINSARIVNKGPMKLTMLGEAANVVGGLLDMLGKKGGDTARALQEVNVSTLDLTGNSTDDKGNMTLKGTVAGNNPVIGRGVQLNLNLTTNLRDMLRSMAGDATSYVKGSL
ncbi:MAG: YdbH domain-containing protein [Alphaproteobacteria bacterium]|nr:YdbH domain-containing protein [Alphaproteobacteria bacterium]